MITNGFDPDDFAGCSTRRSGYFSISYSGQLYAGRRYQTALFDAVHEPIEEAIMLASRCR
jgi:hypothetical protein